MPQKPIFGEHLQHKPMESVFAYILTTDKASYHHVTTQKYRAGEILHNSLQLGDKRNVAWPRSRDLLLNFGTRQYIPGTAKAET